MLSDETVLIQKLQDEHRTLKTRISELASRRYLSPQEEYELKRLRKVKLAKKDQIALLQTRTSATSP